MVLGFDGASFPVVKRLMDDGFLPNFLRLRREGIFYTLLSCIPPITYPAWTSLYTGKNPGKHGIFDFITSDGELVNGSHRRSKAIWELLSDADLSSCIIHMPATHPPDEIKGRIVARQFIPADLSKDEPFSNFPKDLPEKGEEFIIDYGFKAITNPWRFLLDSLRIEEMRLELLLKLMDHDMWNLLMINFGGLDEIQHFLWGRPNSCKQIGTWLVKSYCYMDKILGTVLKKIDLSKDIIFVVSDHGFEPVHRTFNINSFLQRCGLRINSKCCLSERINQKVFPFLIRHEKIALGLDAILEVTPLFLRKALWRTIESNGSNRSDFSQGTVGRALTCFGSLYLQKFDEEIDPFKTKTDIVSKLISLKDPETGVGPIEQCYYAQEVFSGPFSHFGPDIIFKMREGYEVGQGSLSLFHSSHRLANHAPEGILFACGRDIKEGLQGQADIYDITPTILHMLECTIPHDIDGKVLRNIFKDYSPFNREVKYGPSSMTLHRKEKHLAAKDEERIKERLRKLGYI